MLYEEKMPEGANLIEFVAAWRDTCAACKKNLECDPKINFARVAEKSAHILTVEGEYVGEEECEGC